jgi:hypothetical protein
MPVPPIYRQIFSPSEGRNISEDLNFQEERKKESSLIEQEEDSKKYKKKSIMKDYKN